MTEITALSLYIINQVRLRRLTLGIPAKRFSKLLKHSSNYVLNIENSRKDTTYPPHEWPKIADILNCTVHDLLPEASNETPGKLVEKVILSLNEKGDVKKILLAMSNHGFFSEEKSLEDVTKHLFLTDKQQINIIEKSMKDLPEIEILKNDGETELYKHKSNPKDN